MKITFHNFGNFKLDGGSMFGPVPKKLWSRLIEPDEENRIPMASNTLIIEADNRKIIIDAGVGTKGDEKFNKIYGVEPRNEIDDPESITDIVITHLHFDHCGGLTYYDSSGNLKLTYPKAKYHLRRENLETAKNPNVQEKGSYFAENINIFNDENTNLVEKDGELFPGIEVFRSDGHTQGMQYLKISNKKQTIFFPSDLVPTSNHLNLVYHMGFDINTLTLLKEKKNLINSVCSENISLLLQHEVSKPFGAVKKVSGTKCEWLECLAPSSI